MASKDDMKLLTEKYPNIDLFRGSFFKINAGRLDVDFLEHPFFSLKSRGKDMTETDYTSNDGQVHIKIRPSPYGRATIRDADFVAYMQAKLVELKNAGQLTSTDVILEVEVAEFLEFTNRGTGGADYKNLEGLLQRIAGTQIQVEYPHETKPELVKRAYTSIIDIEWSSVEYKEAKQKGTMVSFFVKPRAWVVQPILESNHYLTVPRTYFRIKQDIERRLWQIARKHVGRKKQWTISWEKLYNKLGSGQSLTKLRAKLRADMRANGGALHILDYQLKEDKSKRNVVFVSKHKDEPELV